VKNCGITKQDRAEWRQSDDRKKQIEGRLRKGTMPNSNKDTMETGEDSIGQDGDRARRRQDRMETRSG
jgi:hypothetical protein